MSQPWTSFDATAPLYFADAELNRILLNGADQFADDGNGKRKVKDESCTDDVNFHLGNDQEFCPNQIENQQADVPVLSLPIHPMYNFIKFWRWWLR